jgi:hypothetical protein
MLWKFPHGGLQVKRFFDRPVLPEERLNGGSRLGGATLSGPSTPRARATYMDEYAVADLAPAAVPVDLAERGVAAPTIVRLAIYDSMRAAPRVEEVYGDSPLELIERLSARVYQVARDAGGPVPYMVVRELTENLVHAGFADVVVSIMDDGHVVRFSDAGPGIADPDRALRPGFTTATADMRRYMRGVGSGLPIARECMTFAGGVLAIDRNLSGGAVVTASALEARPESSAPSAAVPSAGVPERTMDVAPGDPDRGATPASRPAPMARRLSDRQKQTLLLVMEVGSAGPTTVSRELTVALSTAHRDLAFLEREGLITGDPSGKRKLTPLGVSYVESLF